MKYTCLRGWNIKRLMRGSGVFLGLAMLIAASLAGCGGPSSKCLLSDERIGSAYLYGMNYLEENKSMLATGAFKSILACNKGFSPAYSGLAIAYAEIAAAGLNPDGRTITASIIALKKADQYAASNEDRFRRHVAAVRAYTIYKSPGWFVSLENEYKLAMKARVDARKLPYYESSDAAAFFMGKAFFDAGRIEDAMAEFKALSKAEPLDKWGRLSKVAFKRSGLILSHIGKAQAGADVVVLVFRKKVRREDLAAILIGELKVDKLLGVRDTGMGIENKALPVPSDIMKSPFRDKILKVISLDIKGLEPAFSQKSSTYLFSPSKVVSRKDFAVIMAAILKRVSAHTVLYKGYSYKERSYSDVPPGKPWQGAVREVTKYNLMSFLSGDRFGPYEALDGTDAFSAVFAVKDMFDMP